MTRKEFIERLSEKSDRHFSRRQIDNYLKGSDWECVPVTMSKTKTTSWRFRMAATPRNQWVSVRKLVYPFIGKNEGWKAV